jgi:hypothetical protein
VLPNQDELTLFFSRLKEGPRVEPFFEELLAPNISKMYASLNADVNTESVRFLKYFLSKLNTVIAATRDIERRVEDFVQSCNKYLSAGAASVVGFTGVLDKQHAAVYQDDKVLRLNRRNLKVHAESVLGGRKISLDALSSGEKQMVSLFAKLFLYPKKKIVLIDEPELSLSGALSFD